MSFIGTQPGYAYNTITKDTFSGNDSDTDFTLSVPATTNGVEVFVENVQQEPTTAYTVSGTTLTFTAAPVTGTNNIYVVHRNPTVQTLIPPSDIAVNVASITTSGAGTFGDGITVDNDGATVATFDRATSDGTIIDLQKDGSSVGVIGTVSDNSVYLASGSHSLRIQDNGSIKPADGSGGTSDNTIDLGNVNNRFRDFYLSGAVFFGTDSSANALDDYEEGTWTPTLAGSSTVGTASYSEQTGSYIKIGNLVTVQFEVAASSWSVNPSGNLEIGNFPFATPSGNQFQATGAVMTNQFNYSNPGETVVLYKGSGSNYANIYCSRDDSSWLAQSISAESFSVIATVTYRTT